MPTVQGDHGTNMGNTNGTLRKEIRDDIISEIGNIADVMRTADSIYLSDNFHLDSKQIGQAFKVEIQYRKNTKQTVSVALVDQGATNVGDLRTALTNSLNDGHIWIVT
ncbi:hypothetical protein NZD89_12325 [Alicyclobacillus fastidiosus]|uniref:Uncharacterized protein n=1 Tax=Alicyclobacillus fastidiosus TaxID=392011 RepID=A0ABY6ZPL4_9BACL|nr:hypothetical protein [Alicyclobacillus fastidiosus]WAH44091.1 hypothetical protein NZD89_12325 [Alicyclobacillus fastidiosus]GMA60384.1 hypothetical protein GCM10025859_08240 [Alicyclobacillus fastidiosus]